MKSLHRTLYLAAVLSFSAQGALLSMEQVQASGIFWLPVQRATHSTLNNLHPALATYHNHAYMLSTVEKTNADFGEVYFTTNESGAWKSQLLSSQGPHNEYSGEFTSLAVDSSTGRLYAAWVYSKGAGADGVGVWMRDTNGQWSSAPTEVFSGGSLGGEPSIVAGNGRAYLSFISSNVAGGCDDEVTRSGDVQLATYDGSNWSAPQNLTSCVTTPDTLSFFDSKLALDESGRAYLLSLGGANLWYMDTVSGSWSEPVRITQNLDIGLTALSPAWRGKYAIAASGGTAYVVYSQQLQLNGAVNGSDVFVMSHPSGGSWSAPSRVSPVDKAGCEKWGLSLVARSSGIGVSYIHSGGGGCRDVSGGPNTSAPHLLTGTLDHLSTVKLSSKFDCNDTMLTSDSSFFRLAMTCGRGNTSTGYSGELQYSAEFLDTVGPVAHLHAPSSVHGSKVRLSWSAHDPSPGSGVASFELQVREGPGSWHELLSGTHAKSLTYRKARSGHHYTFRLRAKDHVSNLGPWVSAGTTAS